MTKTRGCEKKPFRTDVLKCMLENLGEEKTEVAGRGGAGQVGAGQGGGQRGRDHTLSSTSFGVAPHH